MYNNTDWEHIPPKLIAQYDLSWCKSILFKINDSWVIIKDPRIFSVQNKKHCVILSYIDLDFQSWRKEAIKETAKLTNLTKQYCSISNTSVHWFRLVLVCFFKVYIHSRPGSSVVNNGNSQSIEICLRMPWVFQLSTKRKICLTCIVITKVVRTLVN